MPNSDFTVMIEFLETTITELLTQHSAIFVVIASFIFLSFIGKRVSTYQQLLEKHVEMQATFFPIDKLSQGLHIDGLTATQRQNLNKLIKKKDKFRLAMFFATHQPTVQEIESISKNTQSRPELFNFLDGNDIYLIQEHSKMNQKLIDEKFISKFGNLLFMENFIMYSHLCRTNPAVFHIPENNKLRYMFETFVKTGLANQGVSITLEDRLHILSLKELQAIANEISINKVFSTVHEAAATLATSPQTVVRLANKYASNDLFLLKQENWDVTAVKKEWSAYNAYAKLLCAS